MTCTTTNYWKHLPTVIIQQLHTFLDPISSRALAGSEKRTQDVFYAMLPELIRCHFRCAPSPRLAPNDHHLALTISSTPHAISLVMEPEIQLKGAPTVDFVVSDDLTKGLSPLDSTLYLWDLVEGEKVFSFMEHTGLIDGVDISKDGTWAVTKSDNEIIVWNLIEKKSLSTITEKKLVNAKEIHVIPDADPDQKKILSIEPLAMKVWDLNIQECLLTIAIEKNHSFPFAISRDGKTVLICNNDGDLSHYDLVTGKRLRAILTDLNFNSWTLNAQATKAYTTDAKGIKIWDLATGELLREINTGGNLIEELQISADETKIISKNDDTTVSIWHVPSGLRLETFEKANSVFSFDYFKISPDGTQLLLADDDLLVQLVHLAPLPHERVYQATMHCFKPEGFKQFQQLPSFVKINSDSTPITEDNFTDVIAYERLCEYSKTTFLPGIAELFERAILGKSTKEFFSTSAYYRFSLLPPDAKNLVYSRLFAGQLKQGKYNNLPYTVNFGTSAFHNQHGLSATDEERAQAIRGCKRAISNIKSFVPPRKQPKLTSI